MSNYVEYAEWRKYMTFGEKVRSLREDADINQTKLGAATGMTQRKISYLECGRIEPGIDDIIALCSFFGVSADYLLGLPHNLLYPDRRQ